MNLRQIEVFRAVMTAGSVSGAAELLHVSVPAVSRLLSYTESRLGFPLFERIRGRLYATPEARHLMTDVESVYLSVQRVNERAHEILERRHGLLHVVCSPSIGQTLVPQVIARFRLKHPAIRMTFQQLMHQQLKECLLDRKADLGLVILPVDHPNLAVTPIAEGSMVCVFPRKHVLESKAHLTLRDLRPYPLITYARDTPLGSRVQTMFERARLPLQAAIEVGSGESACALVQAGAGIAIIHEFSVRGNDQRIFSLRPLKGAPSLTANLVHAKYEPLSQVAQAFVQVTRSEFKRLGIDASSAPA